MKRTIHVKPAAPQYSVITNITFAQTGRYGTRLSLYCLDLWRCMAEH